MKPSTHKKALEATARVVLSLVASGGCGGMMRVTSEDPTVTPGGDAATTMSPSAVGTTPDSSVTLNGEAAAIMAPPAVDASDATEALTAITSVVDASDATEALCNAVPLAAGARASATTFACCARHIGGFFDAQWVSPVGRDQIAAMPSGVDCCLALASRCDTKTSVSATDPEWTECRYGSAITACCSVVPNKQLPYCAPWGPPVPPAMSDALGVA